MNTEEKKVERILHLNLQVSDDWIVVTSIDNESGETYALDFENESKSPNGWTRRQPRDIQLRIGMEVWSWLSMMMEDLDAMDESEG